MDKERLQDESIDELKTLKFIKDEIKPLINQARRYKSLEKQEFANGLERALAIIEKYERKYRRKVHYKEDKNEQ